ncbi:hypothetical protein LIN78_02140 [Leeia sp. TBRC 13508]|uniref:DUF6896 domain-containing protein n=1 Tax=Leeia speluncae TaxID=2884804 RepID=A0ABS8D2D3_9NEIS|nr:hypothetical protein [Leeia speluncae]MCB6182354.1 hypothetical protein [Leeia speluncae]
MDQRLAVLIKDYLADVATAIRILETCGFRRPQTNIQWAFSPRPRLNGLAKSFSLRKHGIGLECQMGEINVDFDFGLNGEINRFDAWKLVDYVRNNPGKYELRTENEIRDCVAEGIASGEIIREEGSWYLSSDKDA